MEEKNKKKGRRAYLNDFKRSLSGEYIYTGATYMPEGDYERVRLKLVIISVLCTALNIFCGCIPAEPMLNAFYVILPFIVSLIAGVRLLWAAVRLCVNKLPLREYVLNQTFEKILPASTIMAIFSAVTLVGFAVFVIIKGFSAVSVWSVLFAFAQGLTVVLGLLARKISQKVEWKKL